MSAPVKLLCVAALLALPTVALADMTKSVPTPHKLGRDAHVFVLDKDAPSADKTVPLSRVPRPISKNK